MSYTDSIGRCVLAFSYVYSIGTEGKLTPAADVPVLHMDAPIISPEKPRRRRLCPSDLNLKLDEQVNTTPNIGKFIVLL